MDQNQSDQNQNDQNESQDKTKFQDKCWSILIFNSNMLIKASTK